MLHRYLAFALSLTLVAVPAAAQPFIYGITHGTVVTATGLCHIVECRGPQLQITNTLTGRLLNPDDTAIGQLAVEYGDVIAIAPDGRRVYVAISTHSTFASTGPSRLAIVDTTTNQLIANVAMPDGIAALAVAPDSSRVYVANSLQTSITIVDPVAAAVIAAVSGLPGLPTALAPSPDGQRLFVSNATTAQLSIVDTAALTFTSIALPGIASDLVISPDGTRAYAAIPAAFAIAIVDTTVLSVTTRAVAPTAPAHLALTPDGRQLFMTVSGASGFGVLDVSADTFATAVAANTRGGALAIAPDGNRAFLAADTGIIAVDAQTGVVMGSMPGGGIDLVVTPPDPCQFEVPFQDRWFGREGGPGSIQVPAPAGCGWTVQNAIDPAVVTFSSATNGTGPGVVSYTVSPQPAAAASARRAPVFIAGQRVSIVETLPLMAIGTPSARIVGSSFTVGGWAIDIDGTFFSASFKTAPDTGPGVDAVHVWAYPDPGSGRAPIFLGAAQYGAARPDVGTAFGDQYIPSGFTLEVSGMAAGTYQLVVFARGRSGTFNDQVSVTVTVVTGLLPAMSLDTPVNGSQTALPLTIAGWAIDRTAASGTGVDAVHVWAFPADGTAPIFLGAATYGFVRSDIGAIFGAPFAASGFSLTVSRMPAGAYFIVASAHNSTQQAFTDSRMAAITVFTSRLAVDYPPGNPVLTDSVWVSGWAADFAARSGSGIDAVHVWAFPAGGEPPIFVGVAQYGLARPDVAAAFGPAFANAGYQFNLPRLPVGTYYVVISAHSAVTGRFDNSATLTVRFVLQ